MKTVNYLKALGGTNTHKKCQMSTSALPDSGEMRAVQYKSNWVIYHLMFVQVQTVSIKLDPFYTLLTFATDSMLKSSYSDFLPLPCRLAIMDKLTHCVWA